MVDAVWTANKGGGSRSLRGASAAARPSVHSGTHGAVRQERVSAETESDGWTAQPVSRVSPPKRSARDRPYTELRARREEVQIPRLAPLTRDDSSLAITDSRTHCPISTPAHCSTSFTAST